MSTKPIKKGRTIERSGYPNIFIIRENSDVEDKKELGNDPGYEITIRVKGKKFEPAELETSKIIIAGCKLPDEDKFHLHIVNDIKHRQRLWDHYINNGMHFYFIEVDLPTWIKDETPPF